MCDEVESPSACVRVTVSGLPKKDGGHVCLSSTRLHELPEKRAEKGRIDWQREGPSLFALLPDGYHRYVGSRRWPLSYILVPKCTVFVRMVDAAHDHGKNKKHCTRCASCGAAK